MKITFEDHEMKAFEIVAKRHNVNVDGVIKLYTNTMESNFEQDLYDIEKENEDMLDDPDFNEYY